MARAPVLVACLVLADLGVAVAGNKTSKVTIETDPPGAKVYFGLKEDGAICTTPCTVDAPIGETPIIVEAESRRSLIENLIVPRRTARPMKVHYTLALAVGTLIVDGGNGATIKIDNEDKGKAPGRVEGIAAGAHHVVVENNGKALYDDFLEIEAGHESTVTPRAAAVEAPPPRPAAPAISTTTTAPAPANRRKRPGPLVAVTGTMDVGFRQFHYTHNTTPLTQRDNNEVGQVLAGPIIELWPTTLLGLGVLPGLALYGRFEFGVNSLPVTANSMTGTKLPTTLSTSWQSLEVSLHQRWTIAHAATIEVGAGYTQDRYQFTGRPDEIALVPDASYQAVRIGGRASLLLGSIEPFLAIENRLVLSGGAMDERYSLGTSVNGVRGALGVAVHLGHVEVRLEGGATRYGWVFKPDTSDLTQADGGRDLIEHVSVALGYAY